MDLGTPCKWTTLKNKVAMPIWDVLIESLHGMKWVIFENVSPMTKLQLNPAYVLGKPRRKFIDKSFKGTLGIGKAWYRLVFWTPLIFWHTRHSWTKWATSQLQGWRKVLPFNKSFSVFCPKCPLNLPSNSSMTNNLNESSSKHCWCSLKRFPTGDPPVAETSAILWALWDCKSWRVLLHYSWRGCKDLLWCAKWWCV